MSRPPSAAPSRRTTPLLRYAAAVPNAEALPYRFCRLPRRSAYADMLIITASAHLPSAADAMLLLMPRPPMQALFDTAHCLLSRPSRLMSTYWFSMLRTLPDIALHPSPFRPAFLFLLLLLLLPSFFFIHFFATIDFQLIRHFIYGLAIFS